MATTTPIRSIAKTIDTPMPANLIVLDDGVSMGKAELGASVEAVANPLVDEKIAALDLGTASKEDVGAFATATQGGKADSAVQPGDLSPVATTGVYDDLTSKPTLGTAAAKDVGTEADKIAAGDDIRLGYSRAQLVARSIPLPIVSLQTSGYATAGDGGGALYKRVATEPSHAGKAQSADGAWWEIAEKVVTPQMFGAKGDGAADDTAAWNAANSVVRPIFLPPGIYLVDRIDWSDRNKIVLLSGDGATLKKRSDDGYPLLQINAADASSSGYVPPSRIAGITFDADGKADYAVLAYNIARWVFTGRCGFIGARLDGYLQLGGAQTLLDHPDAIGNGRAGIAFDKYAYGYPNTNTVAKAGVFNNGRYGVYFDGGRDLSIENCDVEGNGTDGEPASAGVWVGNAVGSEPGTEGKPGIAIAGGWIEGNKGSGGAVRFGSGINTIDRGYTIANATPYDVLVAGGTYRIASTTFDGVRTHVKEDGAGYGNTIVDCVIAGSHDIDPEKTAVFGSQTGWTSYTPTVVVDAGTISVLGSISGAYQRIGRTMHVRAYVSITAAGTASGDLLIGLPATVKAVSAISGITDAGAAATGVAIASQTYCRARKGDGSSLIADGAGVLVTAVYEVSG